MFKRIRDWFQKRQDKREDEPPKDERVVQAWAYRTEAKQGRFSTEMIAFFRQHLAVECVAEIESDLRKSAEGVLVAKGAEKNMALMQLMIEIGYLDYVLDLFVGRAIDYEAIRELLSKEDFEKVMLSKFRKDGRHLMAAKIRELEVSIATEADRALLAWAEGRLDDMWAGGREAAKMLVRLKAKDFDGRFEHSNIDVTIFSGFCWDDIEHAVDQAVNERLVHHGCATVLAPIAMSRSDDADAQQFLLDLHKGYQLGLWSAVVHRMNRELLSATPSLRLAVAIAEDKLPITIESPEQRIDCLPLLWTYLEGGAKSPTFDETYACENRIRSVAIVESILENGASKVDEKCLNLLRSAPDQVWNRVVSAGRNNSANHDDGGWVTTEDQLIASCERTRELANNEISRRAET